MYDYLDCIRRLGRHLTIQKSRYKLTTLQDSSLDHDHADPHLFRQLIYPIYFSSLP